MIKPLRAAYLISIKVAIALLSAVFGWNHIFGLSFFGLFSCYSCMKRTNSHSSDLNYIGWVHISPANWADILFERVVDFSAELRVFVEVRNMRFWHVNFDCIAFLLSCFMFFLVFLGRLSLCNGLVNIPLLIFGLFELFQHFRSDWTHIEFTQHFLHFLHSHPQLLPFFCQSSNQFVSFTFIDHSFILNLFSLICISKSWKSLIVVVSSWRYGTNHQCFRITSKSVLKDTS